MHNSFSTMARSSQTALLLFLIHALPTIAIAQEAAEFFRTNCMSCHTIGGGRLTGPDLKNVTQRKDRAWLGRFLMDPKSVVDAGDPYAQELLNAARGVVMPTLPGMTKQRADALLEMVEAESKLEKSQFVGMQISDRPFTAADVQKGHELFLGLAPLKNGGPSCISCHSVNGVGGFGGGTLAPELTTVFERYQGRKTLSTWLSAPATPTMLSVFKKQPMDPEEVLAMTAYFQTTLSRAPEDGSTARLNFILIGFVGAAVVLGSFDVFWNKRFRGVRRRLVEERKWENRS